jgi:hypothetical protein
MTKNVGTLDRVIRIVIGLALLSLFFVLSGNARWLGLIAIVPLGTALVGTCPLYLPFGIKTGSKTDGGQSASN